MKPNDETIYSFSEILRTRGEVQVDDEAMAQAA
jgi:hypothetical protein